MKRVLLDYLESQVKTKLEDIEGSIYKVVDMSEEELDTLTRTYLEVEMLTDAEARDLIWKEFPFLVERPLLRDRVEKVFVNRLTKKLPTDKDISAIEFNEKYNQLHYLINSIARERLVYGFTKEDMESFMLLKLHQIMRRGLYDPQKNPGKETSFYAVAFNNLINDINRCKNRAIDKCDSDGLYDALSLDTTEGQPF